MALGRKTGGRQPGSKNKNHQHLDAAIKRLDFDPEEALIRFAMGVIPCLACDEDHNVSQALFITMVDKATVKKMKIDITDPDISEIMTPCPCCAGTGTVRVDEDNQIKAIIRINDSRTPKLASKTIEKTIDKITVKRMNAMSDAERKEAELKIKEEEGDDE